MKLHEIKVLSDGNVFLKDGFYLASHGSIGMPKNWDLRQLLGDHQDENIARATISEGPTHKEAVFIIVVFGTVLDGWTQRYRYISEPQLLEAFYEWVESKLDSISASLNEDLNSDLAKARKKRNQESKEVWLHRLNKDGSESGMHDAKTYFDEISDAIRAHNHRVEANPGKQISHNLVTHTEAFGTFKKKLIGKVKE